MDGLTFCLICCPLWRKCFGRVPYNIQLLTASCYCHRQNVEEQNHRKYAFSYDVHTGEFRSGRWSLCVGLLACYHSLICWLRVHVMIKICWVTISSSYMIAISIRLNTSSILSTIYRDISCHKSIFIVNVMFRQNANIYNLNEITCCVTSCVFWKML